MLRKLIYKASILALALFGLLLRVSMITDFKIFKDSYKFLMIARSAGNFSNAGSYYYSYAEFRNTDMFSLYKWLYGIIVGMFVRLFNLFGLEMDNWLFEITAHAVTVVCSMIGVYLLIKLVRYLTQNKYLAYISGLLLLFSGTAVIWSGFVITDTLAVMLLLGYFFMKFKKVHRFLLFIMALLLFYTRPEFIFIPAILEIVDLADTGWGIFARYTAGVRIMALANFGAFVFISFNSDLFTRNLYGDLLLWLCWIFCMVFLISGKYKSDKDSSKMLYALFSILSVALFLMLTYYYFNKNISRYIVNLVPVFILSGVLAFNIILKKLAEHKKLIIAIGLIFIAGIVFQIIYIARFGQVRYIDYNTEAARYILDYARAHNFDKLYVSQEEAFLWEDWKNEFRIYPIDDNTFSKIEPDSLYINDVALEFNDVVWQSDNMRFITYYRTQAPFIREGQRIQGWVEIWQGK